MYKERRPKKSENSQALGTEDFLVDDLGAGAMTLGTAVIREVDLLCGSGVVPGLGDFELLFLLTPEPYGYFPGGFSLKRSAGVQVWDTSYGMSDIAYQRIE